MLHRRKGRNVKGFFPSLNEGAPMECPGPGGSFAQNSGERVGQMSNGSNSHLARIKTKGSL